MKEHTNPQGNNLKAWYNALIAPYLCRLKWRKFDRLIRLADGALPADIPENGFVLFCGFKNAETYLENLLDHYGRMGCSWFFFYDDGSTDQSREILRQQERVAVFEGEVPYIDNLGTMRGWFLSRYAKDRWAVVIDHDELFDYPDSTALPFSSFLQYLDTNGYEAVTACMVDRFSDKPIGQSGYKLGMELARCFPYYDCSDVVQFPLSRRELGVLGKTPSCRVGDYYGGVRGAQFNFWPRILKVPLIKFKTRHGVRLHMVTNARMADVVAVLHHFRYTDHFFEVTQTSSCNYTQGGVDVDHPELESSSVYQTQTAQRWEGPAAIYEEFLYVSESFKEWVRAGAGDVDCE